MQTGAVLDEGSYVLTRLGKVAFSREKSTGTTEDSSRTNASVGPTGGTYRKNTMWMMMMMMMMMMLLHYQVVFRKSSPAVTTQAAKSVSLDGRKRTKEYVHRSSTSTHGNGGNEPWYTIIPYISFATT